MKFEQVILNGFGKFEHHTCTFENGINVICGQNETGKSTLWTLLKALFYGFDKGEEDHYRPWLTGQYGISQLTYTLDDGTAYTISQKKTKKFGTECYQNSPYQDISNNFSNTSNVLNVLEQQIGLTKATFLSTVWIKQATLAVDPKLGQDLLKRLVNLSQFGDEDIDYQKAVKYLNQSAEDIGTGRKNSYKKAATLIASIEQLKAQKLQADATAARLKRCNEEIDALTLDISKARLQLESLGQLKSNRQRVLLSEYQEKKQQLLQLTKKAQVLEQSAQNFRQIASLTAHELQGISSKYQQASAKEQALAKQKVLLLQAKKQIEMKQSALVQAEATDDLLRERQIVLEIERLSQTNKSTKMLAIIAQVLCFILTIFGMFLSPFLLGFLVVVPILFFWQKTKSKRVMQGIAHLENEKTSLSVRINQYNSAKNELEMQIYHYNQQQNSEGILQGELKVELLELVHKCQPYCPITQENTHAVIAKLLTDFEMMTQNYHQLKQCKTEQQALTSAISALEHVVQNVEQKEDFVVEAKNLPATLHPHASIEQIDQFTMQLQKQINEAEIALSSQQKEIDMLSVDYVHPGDIEEMIKVALDEQKQLNQTKTAITTALEVLAHSVSEMQTDFTPRLNHIAGEILADITNQKYTSVNTNDKFVMTVQDLRSGIIKMDSLSNGTLDQLYFAYRLAAARLLSQHETLPFLLDEPFAQFDDVRLSNILRVLGRLASERQIILMTCHNREQALLNSLQIPYHTVTL
ncbi:MAG: AAA family ATPase [Hyphomonadaceae bacterium]|nr:AAA family ATPase [Clostridia bacterium]